MKLRLMIPLLFFTLNSSAQNLEYFRLLYKADSCYFQKNYQEAGNYYVEAFDNAAVLVKEDYLNAAVSFALADKTESAFKYLKILADKGKLDDPSVIENDDEFDSLKKDSRWSTIITEIKTNQAEAQKRYNFKLKDVLDKVYKSDQTHRKLLNETIKKYGIQSDEVGNLQGKIDADDEKNFFIVSKIIDKYGWLGSDVVGEKGEKALFLTLQHADNRPEAQLKYLKIFAQAIKNGKSNEKADYAYLTDRVSLSFHKYQLYGTQLKMEKNGKLVAQPISDNQNVDKRRQSLGLSPLKYYLSSVNDYKKIP